ncbi:MAG: hypothetical protein CMI31_13615 [Opitutae bacterium]|nr:hypothetical protein [Opitutae bacterium]
MVKTVGSITSFYLEDIGDLIVQGWASGENGEPLDSFLAQVGDEVFQPDDCSVQEPFAGFTDSNPSSSSGFTLRFSSAVGLDSSAKLFSLVPVLTGGHGEPMYFVIESPMSTPSDSLIDKIGGGGPMGFKSVAFDFLGHFIHKGGLVSGAKVLDIGCGVGRMAYALAHYLDSNGVYQGFDICQESIDWANSEIGWFHPNFTFKRIDLQHDLYNPNGVVETLDFRFPYDDNFFDFVYLASVFTHMSANEIRAYLHEIRRVLRPQGTCFLTAFLMDETSTDLCSEGKSSQNFAHRWDEGFTVNLERPEDAVAFEEDLFLDWLYQLGFEVKGRFPGYWSGRFHGHSYQDMLVLTSP